MSAVTVSGHTVRTGGKTVATLTYSGPVVTVTLPSGDVAGRLVRYARPSPGVYTYTAWTAAHPAAPTPSDQMLGLGLPVAEAVGLVLQCTKEVSR